MPALGGAPPLCPKFHPRIEGFGADEAVFEEAFASVFGGMIYSGGTVTSGVSDACGDADGDLAAVGAVEGRKLCPK
jgi:hypothetical protein